MDVLVAFVLGTRPRVTETATGYVVTVPHGRRAFIISPGTEAPSLKGQAAVTRALLGEGGGRDVVVSGHVGGPGERPGVGLRRAGANAGDLHGGAGRDRGDHADPWRTRGPVMGVGSQYGSMALAPR